MNRILTTTLSLIFIASFLNAQHVNQVFFNRTVNTGEARMCTNDAGNIDSFGPLIGQSDDWMGDTIYLCLGDSIFVDHDNLEILTGDPELATDAGVGYAFFDCTPTTDGPDSLAITSDNCITTAGNPEFGFYVYTGGTLSGDVFFFNSGNIQTALNAGSPASYIFAPITFDSMSVAGLAGYEGSPVGECIHLSDDQAFTITYLNELAISELTTSGCSGSFRARGGISEMDNSAYDINIFLQGNPGTTAIISNGPNDHDDIVSFTAPEPGLYVIEIEDGKSCGASSTIMIDACDALQLNFPLTNVLPTTNECLPVTVENFVDLISGQFTVNWDPSILMVTGTQGYHPLVPDLTAGSFAYFPLAASLDPGVLTFSWSNTAQNGVNIPDGDVFFEICFDVVGDLGDCTGFSIDNDSPPTPIEIINGAFEEVTVEFNPGIVCVSDDPFFSLITQDSLTCPSFDDGSFTVLVDEAVAPYTISWNTVPPSGPNNTEFIGANSESVTVNNLEARSYQITIRDASVPALEVRDTIDILAGPVLGITIRDTIPSCFGLEDGALQFIHTSDGFPVDDAITGYTFTWSVPNGVPLPGNTNYITGIPSGSYGITVTDPAECEESALLPVGQPPALRVLDGNTFITDASCTGGGDGEITITAVGGTSLTGNYNYEWSTGLIIEATTTTVTNLNPGEYCVTVTDDNNCMEERCFTVDAIKVLSINELATDALCNGDTNGNLLITGSTSGAPSDIPYTFAWSLNATAPTNTATTSEIMNLGAAMYTVTMTDSGAAVCQVIESFTINQPEPLVTNVLAFTNETCPIGNDGTITLEVTGGTYPYSYSWSHDVLLMDSLATGLSEDNYTIDISDDNGCMAQQIQIVSAPTPPTVTSFADDSVTCSDDTDGQLLITVTPAPGTIITNYEWSTGDIGMDVISLDNLSPGEYIVTITADNACTTIDTALVTAPDPITLDIIDVNMPLCPGESSGQINVFAVGGTSPFVYSWAWINNETGMAETRTGSVLGSIPAGDYSLTVSDMNDCASDVFNLAVSDPPSIVAAFSNQQDTSCSDDSTCDGQITALASYSDGTSGDFIFMWANGQEDNGGNTSTGIQLCEQTQTVNINGGGCGINAEFTINAPEPITVMTTVSHVSCNGGDDGSLGVEPSGGTAPYNFLWLHDGDMTNSVDNLTQGQYNVVITDDNDCPFTQGLTVNEPTPLVLSIDATQTTEFVSCAGNMDGIIVVAANGGNVTPADPYNFVWADNTDGGTINANLAAGTYMVTVTDYKNCMDDLAYTILEPDPITFILNPIDAPLCFGDATVITLDTVFGGANNAFEEYTFEIDNNGLNFPVLQAATVFAGDHLVSVEDINGCSAEMSVSIASPGQINIDLPTTIVVELGDSTTQLTPTITPSGMYTYLWTPADFLSSDTIRNPFVFPGNSLDYTLTIVNENGCIANESVFVELDANRNVYIPNIFSPNGDGYNDKFEIFTCRGVRQVNYVRLFDRWGGFLYEADNIDPNCLGSKLWDGTKNNDTLPPGVYVYMIEVEFLDDVVLLYRGDVSIVR